MKRINVKLGTAPNGEKVWGISYDSTLVSDKTCGTSVEKAYLDKSLPKTSTKEEYHYLVAKELSTCLEEKLINKDDIYNFEFVCMNTTYQKTK